MSQNIVSLSLTEAQLSAVDQALAEIESQLSGLIALNKAQRISLPKMGVKSEAFCRHALSLLSQNPQIVPSSVPLGEAQADLVALDQLRPRVGSTPLTRTLPRKPMIGKKECHVQTKKVQRRVQA